MAKSKKATAAEEAKKKQKDAEAAKAEYIKKMKAKGFAAAVKREDIMRGAELMEAELNDHIAEVIAALQGASSALGFA